MTIQTNEIKLYRSATVGNSGGNGGKMSASEIINNTANNIFPNIGADERDAGSTKYRKVFVKIENDNDEIFFDSKVFITQETPAEDIVVFFPGTQDDTQAALTGTERPYGTGYLSATVSPGASSVVVTVEDESSESPFQAGDTIRISDKESVDGLGNEEFHTVLSISVSGNNVTLNLDGTTLASGYAANTTQVSSVYEAGDVSGTATFPVVTSVGSGDYNRSVEVDSIGGVEEDWTIEFTSSTAFNITGATLGQVGTGNVGSDAAPVNANFGVPYFVLPSAEFSGSFQAGDTITFSTSPAAIPLWFKRVVPAGLPTYAGNNFKFAVSGESA